MQPARVLGAGDVFGDGGGEGDNVVLHLGFDLVDAGDSRSCRFIANGVGGLLRDHSGAGEGL